MTDWREQLREFLDSQPRDYEYIAASKIIRSEPRLWTFEDFENVKQFLQDLGFTGFHYEP